MTMPHEDPLELPQREVQRLLGRCVLQLQQYERLMKALVADHEISGTAQTLETARAQRIANTSGDTLGTLVRKLLGSYIISDQLGAPDEETTNSTEEEDSISMRVHLELPDTDFARIKNELRELVDLRNNLVHHLTEQYDLFSLEGCAAAQDALIAAGNLIDRYYEQVKSWYERLRKRRRHMLKFLLSEEGQELLFNGIAPDGTVYWPAAGIVGALREAANELAVNGWVSIVAASKWITERYPEELPAKYGCARWRDVVHKARVFELKRFEVNGQRSSWYRERKSSTDFTLTLPLPLTRPRSSS
ncbi:OST-HTH/LOTUS domain-containing protein [Yoonia sp. R78084]|uniref:OST-HTH/LOTUS domain-containing protein n=1 Tax=Yoonia sp. R78084 TaxID=3093869 RepID=UPI0037DCAFD9